MNDPKSSSSSFLSWVHFGDLHIQGAFDENYLDFLDLIGEANRHLTGKVDFAFLPGDNADDGAKSQYALVSSALERLQIPVYVIAGDHDKKGGTLDSFREYLGVKEYHAATRNGFRLLFLNAMDGSRPEEFDFGTKQMQWLQAQLGQACSANLRVIVFTHLYPSELLTQAGAFTRLIREFQVELVEMGHTHYNELANDGRTIYATTRSTGQIEEGPPGFSITAIDGDVVSWKFKERRMWPFVMITTPADEKLITRPHSSSHVLRGTVPVHARVWSEASVHAMMCSVDGTTPQPMQLVQEGWELLWNSLQAPDGIHRLRVEAITDDGRSAHDEISVWVNQAGEYEPPARNAVDYENTIGAYPVKGILGTQLGPNENGTKGPWPSWRDK